MEGMMFVGLVVVQHAGGVVAFLGKKSNPVHRSFGRPLATIGRIVATCGWILAGNMDMAKYVAIASVTILILHLIFQKKKEEAPLKKRGSKRE